MTLQQKNNQWISIGLRAKHWQIIFWTHFQNINRNFRKKNKISNTLHVFEQTSSRAIINGAVMKSFKTDLGERILLCKLKHDRYKSQILQATYVYTITYFTTTRALFFVPFEIDVHQSCILKIRPASICPDMLL